MEAHLRKRKFDAFVLVLGVIGLIASFYLFKTYYLDLLTGDYRGSFCDITQIFSCERINLSPYAKFYNTPVSLFGMIWSAGLILLAIVGLRGKNIGALIYFYAGAASFVSLYYIWIEFFVLKALCIPCTAVHFSAIAAFIASLIVGKGELLKYWRRRQMARAGGVLLLGAFVSLLAILGFSRESPFKEYRGISSSSGEGVRLSAIDRFAQCLSEKGVRFYGSSTCGVCIRNKELFGASFQYIQQVECNPNHPLGNAALCSEKKITAYPTWILEDQRKNEISRRAGFQSIVDLAAFSGCKE